MGNNITEENYKEVVLKRSIITCWVLLALCLVIKLFGGNFFNIACEHENFIKVCEFIDNSWIYYVFGFISYNLTNLLLFKCASVKNRGNKNNKIIAIVLSEVYWIFKILVDVKLIYINMTFYSIIDTIALFLIVFIYSFDLKRTIVSIIFMFLFSIVSTFIKNISMSKPLIKSTLITFIYLVDYYIMLVMFYLYECRILRRRKY